MSSFTPTTTSTSTTTSKSMFGGIVNLKRPRSPDAHATPRTARVLSVKRTKASAPSREDLREAAAAAAATASTTAKAPPEKEKDKERAARRTNRESANLEFKTKYSKAFPQWMFYFDIPDHERGDLDQRVLSLEGSVTSFFSNEVTHFISNKPLPSTEEEGNKENAALKSKPTIQSPIALTGRGVNKGAAENLIRKAHRLGMKIWNVNKLDSVLTRCGFPSTTHLNEDDHLQPPTGRTLSRLLESEKRFGTTTERDPSQRRHDYRYFSRNSYFLLVEDLTQQLHTVAAMEYPISRSSDGKEKGTWPVPYCHPLSRGPFIKYDEKEERKRAKQEKREREEEEERAAEIERHNRAKRAPKPKFKPALREVDLRRTVSMSNLQKATHDHQTAPNNDGSTLRVDASAGVPESAVCSGYLAASADSVRITSTYGNTSTVGSSTLRPSGSLAATSAQNQILWSRRATSVLPDAAVAKVGAVGPNESESKTGSGSREKASASSMMPPPDAFPAQKTRVRLLRKMQSTNTIRLPKRDEKTKPGYCESCRAKFEDFHEHIQSRKHQKFALNDGNFAELDCVLARVRRPTRVDVEAVEAANRRRWEARKRESEVKMDYNIFGNDDAEMQECDSDSVSPLDFGEDDDGTDESDEETLREEDDEDEEEGEEDEDEILLSPKKRKNGEVVRDEWESELLW